MNAEGYARRMDAAMEDMKVNQPSSADMKRIQQWLQREAGFEKSPWLRAGAILTGAHEEFDALPIGDTAKLYYNSLGDFTAAGLRRESGAAISAAERLDYFRRYAYGAQDTPRVKKQRETIQRRTVEGTYRAAGFKPGARAEPAAPPAEKPRAPKKAKAPKKRQQKVEDMIDWANVIMRNRTNKSKKDIATARGILNLYNQPIPAVD